MLAAASLLRLVPVWGFLAGHRSGRRSVQNPCTPSGAASCRLVMHTPSEDVPNSISNHTLQAMLAARSPARWGDLAPTFEELNDPNFQKLMVEMSTFNRLFESEAIFGSLADARKTAMAERRRWKTAVEAEGGYTAAMWELFADLFAGDALAMLYLGNSYRNGKQGLRKDPTRAFMWFKRAADLKDATALTWCGAAYLDGEGVEQSDSRGLTMLGVAATLGSEYACAILGLANAEGRHGFNKNPQEATRWYREMQKCDRPGLSTDRQDYREWDAAVEELREWAAAWLREHP